MSNHPLRWLKYLFALCTHYSGIDALYRRLSGPGLVVLMLHRLRDEHDPYPLSTSQSSLRELLDWLRRRDALTGLDDGLAALQQRQGSKLRYAITLDDGYHDNLSLLDPALGQVPAVVYIVTDNIGGEPIWAYRLSQAVEHRSRDRLDLGDLGLGQYDLALDEERERLYAQLPLRLKQLPPARSEAALGSVIDQVRPRAMSVEPEMLSWDDVRRLRAAGMQIGGHTCGHVILSRVDNATARDEISRSLARIESELGAAPRHFAYPNGGTGDFSERDMQLARDAGFKTAATTIEGVNRPGVNPYRLLRHNVCDSRFRAPSGRMSQALFFSETAGLLGLLRNWRMA